MNLHRLALLAAFLLVLGACGKDSDGPGDSGCKSADDCADGEICVDGTCKAGPTSACDPPCAAPTPVCDEAAATCRTCTVDEGCSGETPVCDVDAAEGAGACVGCLVSDDCPGSRVCDPATRTCVTCTEDEGCFGSRPHCVEDQCVTCTATVGCDPPLFCDESIAGGRCVLCTADTGCEEGEVCDTSVGSGRCVTCTALAGCEEPQFCDRSVDGGRCVNCTQGYGCEPPQFCDLSTPEGACVTCIADGTGCADPTPLCDTSVPGGACGACLDDEHCDGDDFCDPLTRACVRCNAEHRGCTDPQAPYCDVNENGGKGECFPCASDDHCDDPRPYCDPTMHFCAECLSSDHCHAEEPFCLTYTGTCAECRREEDCGEDQACVTGVCRPMASVQIDKVRRAPNNSSIDLPVELAQITYLRPAVNTEPAGFFVQAETIGPAVFVAVSPVAQEPPAVQGMWVSFRVNEKQVNEAGAVEVLQISGWNPSVTDGTAPPLPQDLSLATDLVAALDDYESELVALAGTITQVNAPDGGFVTAQFTTEGIPTASESLLLRVPATLATTLGLANGCTFELATGLMWRDGEVAMPSAYRETDFAAVTCP